MAAGGGGSRTWELSDKLQIWWDPRQEEDLISYNQQEANNTGTRSDVLSVTLCWLCHDMLGYICHVMTGYVTLWQVMSRYVTLCWGWWPNITSFMLSCPENGLKFSKTINGRRHIRQEGISADSHKIFCSWAPQIILHSLYLLIFNHFKTSNIRGLFSGSVPVCTSEKEQILQH